MKKSGYMIVSTTEEVDVDITVTVSDVIEFIDDYATGKDLIKIEEALGSGSLFPKAKTLVDEMKIKLLIKAFEKYSLQELENKLEITYI